MGSFESKEKWISISDMKLYDVVIKKHGNKQELILYDIILNIIPSQLRNITDTGTQSTHTGSTPYNAWIHATNDEFYITHKHIQQLEFLIPIERYDDLLNIYNGIINRIKTESDLPPKYDDVSSY